MDQKHSEPLTISSARILPKGEWRAGPKWIVPRYAFGGEVVVMGNEELSYRTRWNLVGEVHERLDGQNGFQFAEELGLFLKGGMRRKEDEVEGPKRKLANALRKKKKKPPVFQITYDQSLGLRELIKRALGQKNSFGINGDDFTQRHFPLQGVDVRTVNVRVEPFIGGETGEQAANRLVAAGHALANTGDLAGFLASHPQEVEKWNWVFALSEGSRWSNSSADIWVPYAFVCGAGRSFDLEYYFRSKFRRSDDGVLVLC